jgi:hypothetical protein
MRLHPPTSDHPGRAVVSPVEDDQNLQVVTAPERLVRALHAAAATERPLTERLTYLRCAVGRSGLKVAAVGLGESGDRGPARWEEVDGWWASLQKPPVPDPPVRAPAGAAEPELF